MNVPTQLIIASRESRLAMWQAEHVKTRLESLYPQCQVSILGMTTKGDQIVDRALSQVGGKGLFVKELEIAMEQGAADLAVHSLKDVPMELPEGFTLAAILEREDPRDAFVSNHYANLDQLPAGSVVGTSSLRRQALISARYPHLIIQPLRGNVDTRLRKCDAGEYAAIILAAAGLKRLGLQQRIRSILEPEQSLPAAGQGAMAIEIHQSRQDLRPILQALNHSQTSQAVLAERSISRAFGGSCQIPLAAFAQVTQDMMTLRAMVATIDGQEIAMAEVTGKVTESAQLCQAIVQELKAKNAEGILEKCRQTN